MRTRESGIDYIATPPKQGAHGYSNHSLYYIWRTMIARCYNEKAQSYPNYGGRGIGVCDEWLNDIDCFFKWAIKNGWKKHLQLSRIDNNGPYSPDNCCFASRHENQNNRRNTIFIEFNGEKRSLTHWAAFLDIPYSQLSYRLFKKKMPVDQAFDPNISLRQQFDFKEAKRLGDMVDVLLKSQGRMKQWVIKKMTDAGVYINGPIFSAKIKGRDIFSKGELQFICNLLNIDITYFFTV